MSTPRPPKRERTRRRLIDAGLQVVAERGEAMTASDVVAVADVSNGTFYNHFRDRDDFIRALAEESLRTITERSAGATEGADPAWRFAVASTHVLRAAEREPQWGRAVLRLADAPTPPHDEVRRHLRHDLVEGERLGRFTHGDDPVTMDLVTGTLMATIRRLAASERTGRVGGDHVPEVIARLLESLGLDEREARSLADQARAAEDESAAAHASA